MDLIQITNILKELIKTNFQNESDLKMLMQLMELIVVQYKRTNKLPDFLFDEFCNLSSARSSIDAHDLVQSKPFQVTFLEPDLNRTTSNKRPRLESDTEENNSFDIDRFNTSQLISIKSEPHYIDVEESYDLNNSIINETVENEIKPELNAKDREQQEVNLSSNELVRLQVDTIREQVEKPKKTPSIFNKIRHAWQELSHLITTESSNEIELFLNELNGLRLIQTQLRLINKTFYIDICTNILLIMGNISEIEQFRKYLIKDDLLFILRVLLNDNNDLVSFLSSRVIVNLIDQLNKSKYRLQAIETDISKAISRWSGEKIKKTFSGSSHTFNKILDSNHQSCQKWACWSLVNLVEQDCSSQLNELIQAKETRRSVKQFARQILKDY